MVQVGWNSKHGQIVIFIISYIFRGTNSTRISTMTYLLTLSYSIFGHITQDNKRVYCGSIWTRISDDISSFASLKWLNIKSTDQVNYMSMMLSWNPTTGIRNIWKRSSVACIASIHAIIGDNYYHRKFLRNVELADEFLKTFKKLHWQRRVFRWPWSF